MSTEEPPSRPRRRGFRTGRLLFVSFLPFTTAIAATHLFASNLSFHELTVSSSAERVAVVLFGLNLTLAIFYVIDPVRLVRTSSRRAKLKGKSAEDDIVR